VKKETGFYKERFFAVVPLVFVVVANVAQPAIARELSLPSQIALNKFFSHTASASFLDACTNEYRRIF
jgi:hypothetical protein